MERFLLCGRVVLVPNLSTQIDETKLKTKKSNKMEALETVKYKGYNIEIVADDVAESPREWDNVGKMVCQHRRYHLGDEQYENNYANSWKEWFAYHVLENYVLDLDLRIYGTFGYFEEEEEIEKVWRWIEKNMIVMPLFLYDHSGITISTSKTCRWDSGQIGFMYITKEDAVKEFGNKNFTKAVEEEAIAYMEAELETYDNYLRGDVYGYRILDKEGDVIDSCFGFYGYDHEESGLLVEAKGYIDYREGL